MLNFNYKGEKLVGRTCLELSLKPFKSLDAGSIEEVCRKLFYDWQKLIDKSESLAVMLWTADGSEILEYSGELSQSFDYCDLIGIGNPTKQPPYEEIEKNNLHVRPIHYREDGVRHTFTYGKLAEIIAALKRVGMEMTGKSVSVIETFDPGPEFANSDFKYRRHPEICKGNIMGKKQWLHCASTLHAEDRKYAAYPDGIPEGTHFGEFLGKQLMCLCKDVGFDGIWLSNGFGFSLNSWNWVGETFDGEKFNLEGFDNVRNSINEFWKHFTAQTGDMLIEVRGSNLSVGMDISAHGCPVDDIYKYNILTPPNSPWAALDTRFGLELCGYLSRISEISDNGFLFRYYTHDPWWNNSPWFDRYGSQPHDIYLPLALARMDGEGRVTKPFGVNFLSADDSYGDMPEKCPNEVVPHILEGFNSYSDAPGLVTWLYPFEEYCTEGLKNGNHHRIIMDDWYMENAIDLGFPVNTVVSDRNFSKSPVEIYKKTIIVCPVPFEGSTLEKCVFKAIDNGVPVILFGNTDKASCELRNIIGVKLEDGIDGELKMHQNMIKDVFEDVPMSDTLVHVALVSDGGIKEVMSESAKSVETAYVTSSDGVSRVYSTFNSERRVAWIRASFPHRVAVGGHLPEVVGGHERFPCASLLRAALAFFGIDISFEAAHPADKLPLNLWSRKDNGLFMTGFAKNTAIALKMSFPDGVPMPVGTDAVVNNNVGKFISLPWCHNLCRAFVKQEEKSTVSCRRETAGTNMMSKERISLAGLKNAQVVFFPPENANVYASFDREANSSHFKPDRVRADGSVVFENISGKLFIFWIDKDTEAKYREIGYIL